MNILAIETATSACAMGLRTGEGVELTLLADDERHHTEALTPGIRDLLNQVGLAAKSIDRVVVDRGPGLFTGLRVGIATAIGIALATGADLVGVTSLELLAHGARSAGVRGTLVACVDGRRGEVFVQTFFLDDVVVAKSEPSVAVPTDVTTAWATNAQSVTFTGDGVARYVSEFRDVANASIFEQLVPSPLEALRLGSTRPASAEIVPLYLRESDAVANFSTRQRFP
ncbi:MAG TPA: tRNA (adenosine(37)-N6)-threonylcarbamoyltransferase complex dimerization subunit type 1 TsaB [Acidimicrobiales bacterium]|nr:tRNA (adenosine(37)-N6)-threonylcarbamoyltransferase complex dimerization subunit type 1 TsaB [Acidimicrobiales bacterium]